MQGVIEDLDVKSEYARSSQRFRLLLSSALSIFMITFQGSVDTALSTFDCKEVGGRSFLRLNPRVECNYDETFYVQMVIASIFGLIIYCLLLPCVTVVILQSQWCRDVYVHDNVAHKQIFGFLTNMYSKTCYLWELVATLRKLIFVSIPILVSRESLVQSTCILFVLIVYTFTHIKLQPMYNSMLNQIELLSCISVIVGAFAAVFFVIEYDGRPLLAGVSRDLAGIALVLTCSLCTIISLRIMYTNFRGKASPIFYSYYCLNFDSFFLRFDADVQKSFYFVVDSLHYEADGISL
jgi:hypothetical protein